MDTVSERRDLLPATAELLERIGWFIRLRWLAVAGVTLFMLAGREVLPADLHLRPVFITLAFLALYNGLAAAYLGRLKPRIGQVGSVLPGDVPPGPRLARWLLPRTLRGLGYEPKVVKVVYFVNFQMLLDLVFLAVLLHYTGGIENPLRMFLLFHVIIAAILLSRRATYFYATVALLLMSFVTVGEMLGSLPHYSLSAHWRPEAFANPRLAVTQLFLLGTTLYITAYMASSIAARLRRKELDVFLLTRALEEKAERLELAYGRVSEAERAKSQYMRKVAHELRGPLGTIQTALGVAIQKDPQAQSTTSADLIRRAWRRAGELAELTRELLALSRARDGKGLADATRFRLQDVTARVLEEMEPRAAESGLTLRVDVSPDLPEITADPEGMTDLLSNLLGNAIRYTHPGGTVRVGLRAEGDSLLLEVSDTGIGIEKQDMGRIFEEFYRTEAARAHTPDGSGLGMAIVKAVVEQHGGRIEVESEPGRGTRIAVEIPLERRVGP